MLFVSAITGLSQGFQDNVYVVSKTTTITFSFVKEEDTSTYVMMLLSRLNLTSYMKQDAKMLGLNNNSFLLEETTYGVEQKKEIMQGWM